MIIIYEKYRIGQSFDLACRRVISNGATHEWGFSLSEGEIRQASKILYKLLAYLKSKSA
jgi:hypothetical protein